MCPPCTQRVPSPDVMPARCSCSGRGVRLISSLASDATGEVFVAHPPHRVGDRQLDAVPAAELADRHARLDALGDLAVVGRLGLRPGVSPRPSRSPNVRLRDSGDEQVATRSPSPARPAKVSGSAPERDAQPADLGEPAGDQRGAAVVAQPHARGHPDRERDHVLPGAAELAADHVGVGVGAEVAGHAGVLQGDGAVVVAAGDHRGGRLARGDLAGEVRVRTAPRRGPTARRRPRRSPRSSAPACPARRPWPG